MNSTAIKKGSNRYNQSNVYIYFLFLASPLIALIVSISNYKQSWSKNIIWLFSTFFGFTFVIGNIFSDVNRYKDQFREIVISDISFGDFFAKLLRDSGGSPDYIQPLLFYVVSIFSNDFRVVLAVCGLIFGYFYTRNIWNILNTVSGKVTKAAILFIIVFSIIFAIWDINVLRFTIAAHIYFFGAFNLIVLKKRTGYFFIALSVFMHFALSIAVVVLLLYKLFGNNARTYMVMFVLSLGVSEIDFVAVRNVASVLPDSYVTEANEYVNEDFLEFRNDIHAEKNWRGKSYQPAIKWSVVVLLMYMYVRRKEWLIKNQRWFNLFCFVLLFLSVFNVLSNIPVMNRFLFVGYLFSMAVCFAYFNFNQKTFDKMVCFIVAPALLFFFVVKVRIGFEFTGFFTIFGNPFTAIFNQGDVAFINYLK